MSDPRYDTGIAMENPAGGHVWQMAVPNGTYALHMVSGDPSNFDSIDEHGAAAELAGRTPAALGLPVALRAVPPGRTLGQSPQPRPPRGDAARVRLSGVRPCRSGDVERHLH